MAVCAWVPGHLRASGVGWCFAGMDRVQQQQQHGTAPLSSGWHPVSITHAGNSIIIQWACTGSIIRGMHTSQAQLVQAPFPPLSSFPFTLDMALQKHPRPTRSLIVWPVSLLSCLRAYQYW